jgi:hypothetical protein
MKSSNQRMRLTAVCSFACVLALAPLKLAHADEVPPAAEAPSVTSPAGIAGMGAVAIGAVSMFRGITLIALNGDRSGCDTCNTHYETGPAGFMYLGLGAASAMAGAALIDWAALTPEKRNGRSAHVRRWSYAAIGAGTLLASVGGALVLNEKNDRNGVGNAELTAGRAFGWPAAVIGTAVALVGIEGLALDVFSPSDGVSQSKSALGLSFRGRF